VCHITCHVENLNSQGIGQKIYVCNKIIKNVAVVVWPVLAGKSCFKEEWVLKRIMADLVQWEIDKWRDTAGWVDCTVVICCICTCKI
jgi:hypothetical protein